MTDEEFIVQERKTIRREYRVHTIENAVIGDLTVHRHQGLVAPGEREGPNDYVQRMLDSLPAGDHFRRKPRLGCRAGRRRHFRHYRSEHRRTAHPVEPGIPCKRILPPQGLRRDLFGTSVAISRKNIPLPHDRAGGCAGTPRGKLFLLRGGRLEDAFFIGRS